MNGMERYFSHWRSFNATGKQLFQIRFLRSKIWEHPILSSECNFKRIFLNYSVSMDFFYSFVLLSVTIGKGCISIGKQVACVLKKRT